jgi:hypothetical protein
MKSRVAGEARDTTLHGFNFHQSTLSSLNVVWR